MNAEAPLSPLKNMPSYSPLKERPEYHIDRIIFLPGRGYGLKGMRGELLTDYAGLCLGN